MKITTSSLLAIVLLALSPQKTHACDACNVAFGKQLEESRAGSLIAQDFQKAVENQSGLTLTGLGSGAFKPQQAEESAEAQKVDPVLLAHNGDATLLAQNNAGENGATPPPAAPVSAATVAASKALHGVQLPNMLTGPYDKVPDAWKEDPNIEVIRRDYNLPIPATAYVPQDATPDKSFTIELSEGKAYIGNGVVYDGFVTNGSIPGPLIVVDEGDLVEMTVVNKGNVPHGASIHAAGTQTSKYLGKINPGDQGRVLFRVTQPGVYLYHCAPGGHAIPMHVMFGQYGMMVVKPKVQKYKMEEVMGKKPDLEIYMVQHELYASGQDAVEGKAAYNMFNGKLFRYIEEPIKAKPGDYVRIYYLNVGPNHVSTFHIVGINWDYVYWQGQPSAVLPGGQSVLSGPTDSWVIDFRVPPDEGAYTILDHAVGASTRGAIGFLVAEKDAERSETIMPEGVTSTPEEMAEIEEKAVRTVSPFKPTNIDEPVRYAPGTKEVTVKIIGNSFQPKIIEVEPGTTVRWVNEDVFAYLAGEFAGIHNAQSTGDHEEGFNTPLLAHGESATHTFNEEAEYDYICTPHPYMQGKVIVKKSEIDLSQLGAAGAGSLNAGWLVPLAGLAFLVSLIGLYRSGRAR